MTGYELAFDALETLIKLAEEDGSEGELERNLLRLRETAQGIPEKARAADAAARLGDLYSRSQEDLANYWYDQAASEFQILGDTDAQGRSVRAWALLKVNRTR